MLTINLKNTSTNSILKTFTPNSNKQIKCDTYKTIGNVTTGWIFDNIKEPLLIFIGVMMIPWLYIFKNEYLSYRGNMLRVLQMKLNVCDLLQNTYVCLRFSTIKAKQTNNSK